MSAPSGRSDRLDFFENKELIQLFHCSKTEISCLEKPGIFIRQLRDHDLVPEDEYKRMNRMKSKEDLMNALYDLLDWLERERSQDIKLFWKCVFKETMLNHYPDLRTLHNDLMNGSFDFGTELPKQKETKSAKQKRKLRSKRACDDDDNEGNAGPSTPVTRRQKKKPKIHSSSTLKKQEKGDLWTRRYRKKYLPVSCGDQKGTLHRERLAKGEKCISVDKQWFTPTEFERFSGKQSYKNWKMSIRCHGIPLGKFIEEGHLKVGRYTRSCKKFASDRASTGEEGRSGEKNEQQPEANQGSSKNVFKVTCGAVAATLHQKRFASGSQGKSIRTETCWMTPLEFAMEALGQRDVSWRKDIECEGQPLHVLIEDGKLVMHSVCCDCSLCKPDSEDLEDEKNDDECCICKRGVNLVMCDQCPHSFHQKCHLPHVDDRILGDDSTWLCTFCVFRSNQQYFYRDEQTMEAAMSRQISQHMLECQYLFLHLCCADADQTFAEDPNLYLSDYSTVVKTPMWLRKIADKLQEQRYQTIGEFVSDVDLIFTNCASYNRGNAEFLAYGNRLKELFDGEFKKVFNIQ
ncbi:uncharacterized protein V6R79_026387 [Siganus canaliculatus]